MKKAPAGISGPKASALISEQIAELGDDWRGAALAKMRSLIQAADPDVLEEVKWGGVAIWSHDGILTTGEVYKETVKLTFAKGASLKDPKKLFNSSLEGNTRRAIDIKRDDKVNEAAFKALIKEAVALNTSKVKKPAKKK